MRPFLLLLISLAATAPASADQPCGPDRLERGTVARIGGDGSIDLADGTRLRLAGLHSAEPRHIALRTGDQVAFGPLDEADRWSRIPAIVFALPEGGEPVWLQGHMARSGSSYVKWEPALGGCWPLLAAAEARAATRQPLSVEAGRFARIEGRVSRIGEGRTAHFLTVFSDDGLRTTIMIQKRHMNRMKLGGVDVAGLKGHIVRVRGVRGLRNPQVVAAARAEQIEIVR